MKINFYDSKKFLLVKLQQRGYYSFKGGHGFKILKNVIYSQKGFLGKIKGFNEKIYLKPKIFHDKTFVIKLKPIGFSKDHL